MLTVNCSIQNFILKKGTETLFISPANIFRASFESGTGDTKMSKAQLFLARISQSSGKSEADTANCNTV